MRDSRELAGAWSRFQSHGFVPPPPDLADLVSRYWWARWNLRGEPDYVQLIVPYPSVQLTLSTDAPPLVRGVCRGRIRRTLSGRAAVFGVTFRPGVFRRFLNAPVDSITDRAVPATTVFGEDLPAPDPAALLDTDPPAAAETMATELGRLLRARRPPDDPVGDEVAGWVSDIAATPDLRRVDHLTSRYGVGARRLQRLFAEHVGISPKWVIRRFRLHEVTQRMATRAAAEPIDWAALAFELGYADQAHLVRDFTNMFGEPPTSYAARY
ncbi:AraC family transcriptional regulator [Dactylosporangium sp. CA-139066]|uniref:AraC family transcriptional regulator n=1 Tax=Dactylosporangium sp. CA-139066 TaxID=3239930 RepID=UPI003D8C0E7F